ncbi:MAG: hypothetical protein JWQ50_5492 [Caballeronia mineralivorans]|jgi:hypothetical protein|nr:hypothetical protein [Caballeronia mineralivorans]MEA3099267.1 hypothetical protein [Caballeronia mineralivorans]
MPPQLPFEFRSDRAERSKIEHQCDHCRSLCKQHANKKYQLNQMCGTDRSILVLLA